MSSKSATFTKHGLIVLLLWICAPIAWYLMWKDRKYHRWFPHLLWINGAVFGFITAFNVIYNPSSPIITPIFILIVLCFSLLQVIAGLSLQKYLLKSKKAIDSLIIPMISIFFIDILLGYLYVIV